MNEQDNRPWYKKKRYIISIIIASLFIINANDNASSQTKTYNANEAASVGNIIEIDHSANTKAVTSPSHTDSLSNDDYYENSKGNTVHSPAYSLDDTVPSGASALCRDGTYSFSQSRRGTCSHHGGVDEWL